MTWTIGVMVALALFGIFAIMQQVLSRVMYLEVALSQGVPAPIVTDVAITVTPNPQSGFDTRHANEVLPCPAIVVFASATCTTCIRLVDDLGDPGLVVDAPLHVYFDREAPRVAHALSDPITVHDHADDIIDGCNTPALPYGIIMRDGAVVAHDSLPSLHRLTNLALGVGAQVEIVEESSRS